MNTSDKKIWFPAKTYGWGWGWGLPCCWQGWVVIAVYFALFAAGIIYFELPADTVRFVLYCLAISGILIAVCWLKGEKPRWRWGK